MTRWLGLVKFLRGGVRVLGVGEMLVLVDAVVMVRDGRGSVGVGEIVRDVEGFGWFYLVECPLGVGVVDSLIERGDEGVLGLVALNSGLGVGDVEKLFEASSSVRVLAGIAQNVNTPYLILRELMVHPDFRVRYSVVLNSGLTSDDLRVMVEDVSGLVRFTAVNGLLKRGLVV